MNTILLIQLIIIITTTIFNINVAAEKPAQFLGTIRCETGNWDAGHVDLVKKDTLDEQVLTKSNLNKNNEFDITSNVDLNSHLYLKIHYECGNGRTGVKIFDQLASFLKKFDEKDVFNIKETILV